MQIEYADLKPMPLARVEELLLNWPKTRVGDLRILDLVLDGDGEAVQGHGVYLFFGPDGECLYVGRALAPSFLERIPWHFSTFSYSWGNQLLKDLAKNKGFSTDRLVECARIARDYRLLLIRVVEDDSETTRKRIRQLERLLIKLMQPKLNRRRPRVTLPELDTALLEALGLVG